MEAPSPTRLDFKVNGLDCAEEARQIRQALRGIAAEDQLVFDYVSGRLRIEQCGSGCTVESVRMAIAATGMRAVPWEEHAARAPDSGPFLKQHGRALLTAASGAGVVLGFAWHAAQAGPFAALAASEATGAATPLLAALFYIASTALGGLPLLPKAWRALRGLRPDIHLLVVIAAGGALALGNFAEAALVVFLFAVSLWLESYSVGRARHAVSALMALTPPTARYICPCDGDLMEKPVAEVPLGATVLLRPGERVPLDGTVTKGASHLDQSPITGESRPVPKSPGDAIYAGSINHEGALEFRADRPADDTQLARMLHLVEAARAKRAPSEQFVERFARVYTPAVMALALAVAVLGPIVAGMAWLEAFYAALVLLLIACPCALVIGTPVAIFAGLAAAARHGVLIKGGNFLEAPARLRAFAFDKTGTLTLGRPEVRTITPLNGVPENEVLALAAGLAAESQHVHAQAIARHAAALGVSPVALATHTMRPGAGVEGLLGNETAWMGNHRLLMEHLGEGAPDPAMPEAAHSLVYVGRDRRLLGAIALADTMRPGAPEALAALQTLGVAELVMLTGDNAATAREIAADAGATSCRAELLPAEKVAAVEALAAQHGGVAMVGDGVNDAPALAAATVGIAMGAIGTDAAIETADIALMRDDLALLPWLVTHSRRTLRIIQQNIGLALGLKAAVFVLSLTGHAALWLAILADMGASFLVIANGLRLLHGRPVRRGSA